MALLGTGQLTLMDWSKRLDPDGKVAPIAEVLSQENLILEDITWTPGNLPTGHRVSIRTGLPTVYYRTINAGIPTSKSTTAQVDESVAMLEARSHIDMKELKLNGNSAAYRLSEESAFIEAMGQKMAGDIFNGNPGVDPKQFLGLATRYSTTTAGNGGNIILAGGSGTDNGSIYLVVWAPDTVFGIFPKGSQAGLSSRDLGEESVQDANGGWYQAARSLFEWEAGLVVKDWRYVVRIANIDISDWVTATGTQASAAGTNVMDLMLRAIARIPNISKGRAAFYSSRSIQEGLMVQARKGSVNSLSIVDSITQFGSGIKELRFMGIPVRGVDQLGIAETLVS